MAMDQELPLGLGEFSITMDAASFSSLWPPTPLLPPDLHPCQHPQESMEEVKRRLAAATAELEAVREEVRRKEQSIAALVELVRRTAEERDQLQQHLLLARKLAAAATSSSSDSGPSLPSFSPPAVDPPALLEASSAAVVAEDKGTTIAEDKGTTIAKDDRSTLVTIDDDRTTAVLEQLAAKRPLPQRGRLLEAVMEAGPLLESLLVAGPVPQWRNPPPMQPVPSPVISAPPGSRAPMGWGPW